MTSLPHFTQIFCVGVAGSSTSGSDATRDRLLIKIERFLSGAASGGKVFVPAAAIEPRLQKGEGILDAYIKPANKETGEPRSVYESVLLTAANHALIEQIGVRDTVTVNNLIHRYGRREPP